MSASSKKRALAWLVVAIATPFTLAGCSFKSNDLPGLGYPKGTSSVNDISL
ncbi:MAG: hypothetical protein RLZZ311_869, partial [Actinomycetota bacterium]